MGVGVREKEMAKRVKWRAIRSARPRRKSAARLPPAVPTPWSQEGQEKVRAGVGVREREMATRVDWRAITRSADHQGLAALASGETSSRDCSDR